MQSGRRRLCNVRKATWTAAIARATDQSGVVEDPTARLETSCTRTGRPRRHLRPTRQQVGGRRLRPYGPRVRLRGVGQRHSTDESFEQRRKARRRRVRREGCWSRRTLSYSTRTRHRAGERVSQGWASVRTGSTLGRYLSAIRAACANERSCGSARGAISNGRPYRDLIDPVASVSSCQSSSITTATFRKSRLHC